MTLSGRIAAARADVDTLTAVPLGIVSHVVREADKRGGYSRLSAGPHAAFGQVDTETGAYRTAAGAMTEAERRAAGMRRNGKPRRSGGPVR